MVALTLAFFGGGAFAASKIVAPANDGVIYGCYNDSSGDLKVTNYPYYCVNSGGTVLPWYQSIGGYDRVQKNVVLEPSELTTGTLVTVDCPAGTKVLGGGFFTARPDIVLIYASYPTSDTSWGVMARNSHLDTPNLGVSVYATCAQAVR